MLLKIGANLKNTTNIKSRKIVANTVINSRIRGKISGLRILSN